MKSLKAILYKALTLTYITGLNQEILQSDDLFALVFPVIFEIV